MVLRSFFWLRCRLRSLDDLNLNWKLPLSVAERLALQASNVVLGSVINLAEGSECKRVESNMLITRILEGVGVGGNLHDES